VSEASTWLIDCQPHHRVILEFVLPWPDPSRSKARLIAPNYSSCRNNIQTFLADSAPGEDIHPNSVTADPLLPGGRFRGAVFELSPGRFESSSTVHCERLYSWCDPEGLLASFSQLVTTERNKLS
jgi:hypothetical protein